MIKGHYRLGVGMVLLNGENKVFAGKRKTPNSRMVSWFLNKPWQMPQGGIEQGESPLDAALRELREEIGTDKVELVAESEQWFKYVIPQNLRRNGYRFVGQQQKWFLLRFLGSDEDINLKSTNHSEFDSWRWMTYSNLIRLSVHFKRSLYSDVFAAFKTYFVEDETPVENG